MRAQLIQCLYVDPTFEIDDFFYGVPEIDPAPAIEFRRIRLIKPESIFAAYQPQHKPSLLLANTKRLAVVAYKPVWQAVTEPVVSCTKDGNVIFRQADFFVQFAIHRDLGTFALQHSALGKLPSFAANPAGKQQLAVVIGQYDADVGPKALGIDVIAAHLDVFPLS